MSGVDEEHWKLYDAEEFHGVPVSLQPVGRRFEDEKVLAILEYITEKVGLPLEKCPRASRPHPVGFEAGRAWDDAYGFIWKVAMWRTSNMISFRPHVYQTLDGILLV